LKTETISIKGHDCHIAQSSYHLHDLTYGCFCKTHVSHGNYVLSLIAETNTGAEMLSPKSIKDKLEDPL
jgi:hypothetical protein